MWLNENLQPTDWDGAFPELDFEAAASRIGEVVPPTPLVPLPGSIPGVFDLRGKMENRQVTGSFKARGALNNMLRLTEEERALADARALRAGRSGNVPPERPTLNLSQWRHPLSPWSREGRIIENLPPILEILPEAFKNGLPCLGDGQPLVRLHVDQGKRGIRVSWKPVEEVQDSLLHSLVGWPVAPHSYLHSPCPLASGPPLGSLAWFPEPRAQSNKPATPRSVGSRTS